MDSGVTNHCLRPPGLTTRQLLRKLRVAAYPPGPAAAWFPDSPLDKRRLLVGCMVSRFTDENAHHSANEPMSCLSRHLLPRSAVNGYIEPSKPSKLGATETAGGLYGIGAQNHAPGFRGVCGGPRFILATSSAARVRGVGVTVPPLLLAAAPACGTVASAIVGIGTSPACCS